MNILSALPLLLSLSLCQLETPKPAPAAPSAEWTKAEEGILRHHVQLTSSQQFRKAGESYFSPDGTQIIFQAIEREDDPLQEQPFYQMYVGDLVRDGGRVTGLMNIRQLSPSGSSNTCGWFHPTKPGTVMFASTLVAPSNPSRAGYQRKSRLYVWQFPQEMDIFLCDLAKADGTAATLKRLVADPNAYLAEGCISADGRHLVYCEHNVSEGKSGGDLYVMDLKDRRKVLITADEGYDGGPFFSPDGRRICYRSDRKGNDLLQIFVAELAFDQSGNILGMEREFQLTDNVHVNWAPFWHPEGRHLIYTTSAMGHDNYEVFMIDADPGTDGPAKYGTRPRRVTNAAGFDGLPVFNADGSLMMWTAQRDNDRTSQVWLAEFVLPIDSNAAEEKPQVEEPDARPERLKVTDPESGLIYLYDPVTHELSVYSLDTHEVRPPNDKAEIDRAMRLFREQKAD
ncbi:MAG: hypothetical protein AAF581_01950 [Planctomycetota bacterium]